MPFNASNIARFTMAMIRDAFGGGIDAARIAESITAFHSVTTSGL
jgi:hypothetical protein